MQRKVIDTADGSKTLFIPEMDEQYHSVNGAKTESEYVFLKMGYSHHPSKSPIIFEVGFGTGLNALLTCLEAEKQKRPTSFVTIEKYPLDEKTIVDLNYGALISKHAEELFSKVHSAKWGETTKITEYFSLLKIEGDLTSYEFENSQNFDVVYFDAFGPDKQASMWSAEIFSKIFQASARNSVFVTYSAKGVIRRRLRDCGYLMERLPGPPGKRQMLRGTKTDTKME